MSLDALAPDQRAVVQLVLQQGRSYADLAGMLGIAEDAVRERAHRGLAAIASPDGLDPDEQAEVSDYLLSQGSASAREATRSLLRTDADVNAWAADVAAELTQLRGARVPEVPEPTRRRRPAAAATAVAAELPEDAPGATDIAPPEDLGTAGSGVTTPDGDAGEADDAPAVRARPRPKRAVAPSLADEDDTTVTAAAPRSSRLGGVLLIGVVALAVVALVVFLVTRGDDEDSDSASTGPTASATASGTPAAEPTPFKNNDELLLPVNTLEMAPLPGSNSSGQISFFLDQQDEDSPTLTFTLRGAGFDQEQAYAIWLIGGGAPYRVGYASNIEGANPVISADGELQIRGPEARKGSSKAAQQTRRDAQRFTRRMETAEQIVLARATDPNAKQPGAIVLSTDLRADGSATAAPTP